jgi:hypothetical protein
VARKKIKDKIAAVNASARKWKFETTGTPHNFRGMVIDEKGKFRFEILENGDYNQLSRLIGTSKYMKDAHDMRGLAQYLMDRNLVPMSDEEKVKWKDGIFPISIIEEAH